MRIQIINGVFGYRAKDKNGNYGVSVEPKTRLDPPFEVDDELARDLIARGIAEAVATPQERMETHAAGGNTPTTEPPQGAVAAHLEATQFSDMTNADLKKLAEKMGLDTSKCRKKADYISLIAAAEVYADPDEDAVEDGECPPDLGAEAPVV